MGLSGIKLSGVSSVMAALDKRMLTIGQASEVGVKKGLQVLKATAQEILEQDQTNNWPDADGGYHKMKDGSLYKSFRKVVVRNGNDSIVSGVLMNTDVAAKWLEDGTKRHDIHLVKVKSLSWYFSPGLRGSSKGHSVSGITAIHFMARAYAVGLPEFMAVYTATMKRGGFAGIETPDIDLGQA